MKVNKGNYATLLKPLNMNSPTKVGSPIPYKTPTFNNGVPRVTWTEDEVKRMNVLENLQYTVIGKLKK
ncbi:hypothetical protein R3W88_032136 [Solanum pinnatisectum]|uniref:Uncharacterized protein n=1 Tax=Solanum pinnatisectum TaxID=50273 RepID=A0AAV9LRR5_9SOLN|nr:hypothetical protein R3W88_032136 [Solanum pinnatisectum]